MTSDRELSPELLARVLKFIDAKNVKPWLSTSRPSLGDRTPQELLNSGEQETISDALEKIEKTVQADALDWLARTNKSWENQS